MLKRRIVNKSPLEPRPLEIGSTQSGKDSVFLCFMCPGFGGEVSLHRYGSDNAPEEEGDLHPRQTETSSAGDDQKVRRNKIFVNILFNSQVCC